MAKTPIIALMYDFDKTLSTKDMQEYTFIPMVNMTPQEFWDSSNKLSKEQKMDKILAYMYTMLRKADQNDVSIQRKTFTECGRSIKFFPGLDSWFERINEYGKVWGATVEHYIISSGLKEIIEGSPIGHEFKEIYGCEYYYDSNGVAKWPATVVNYTSKTQYLFRINKGVLDVSDDDAVNEMTPEDERPIPFRNMIYFGDGLTDIPCMKLVQVNGGKSIAVCDSNNVKSVENAKQLLLDGRVNYAEVADYREGSDLENLVKKIIKGMVINHELVEQSLAEKKAFLEEV